VPGPLLELALVPALGGFQDASAMGLAIHIFPLIADLPHFLYSYTFFQALLEIALKGFVSGDVETLSLGKI
jgi:hypothetical protein